MLIVFGGHPGVGKTTLARALAARLGCVALRVDTIEAALWTSGVGRDQPTGLAAYVVAEAVAAAALEAGATVIVDACNPVEWARRTWRELAARTGRPLRVIEIDCDDAAEHRRRVEQRTSDITAFPVPAWDDVRTREYEPWDEPRLIVDSTRSVEECMERILDYVERGDGAR